MRIVAWCALAPILAAAAAPPDPVLLNQIMGELATVRHIEALYTERRTLRALRAPIETHGVLRFTAPDQLEKATDPAIPGGAADRLAIDGNQLTIDRGAGKPPLVLALHDHPEIGVLVESIRATLSGDGDALRRVFDITVAGNLAGWQLVLQPHDPAQRGLLQWMRITGFGKHITKIDSQDGDGDHADMTIQALTR